MFLKRWCLLYTVQFTNSDLSTIIITYYRFLAYTNVGKIYNHFNASTFVEITESISFLKLYIAD